MSQFASPFMLSFVPFVFVAILVTIFLSQHRHAPGSLPSALFIQATLGTGAGDGRQLRAAMSPPGPWLTNHWLAPSLDPALHLDETLGLPLSNGRFGWGLFRLALSRGGSALTYKPYTGYLPTDFDDADIC